MGDFSIYLVNVSINEMNITQNCKESPSSYIKGYIVIQAKIV